MKRYIDATKCGCIAIYAKNEEGKPIEIVQAGTTMNFKYIIKALSQQISSC